MPKVRSDNNVGNRLTELRRSNAAGFHERNEPRGTLTRRAIEMSILDGDDGFSPDDPQDDDPSLAELTAMEEEYGQDGAEHPELVDYYKLLAELGIDENNPESYDKENDVQDRS